jgi:hypothetical protein
MNKLTPLYTILGVLVGLAVNLPFLYLYLATIATLQLHFLH